MSNSSPFYLFNAAIVRKPAASVVRGLRAEDSGDPDYAAVQEEHREYIAALESAGLDVMVLPALEKFPDSIFVEDPALVFTEGAVLLNPGAPSRQGEAMEIAPVLHDCFDTVLELPEGHADGGDILVTPQSVLIGLSARTDPAGAAALAGCLSLLGRSAEIVRTPAGILHLKTECSLLDEETVLLTRRISQTGFFDGFRKILLPEGEEPAANVVRINGNVLVNAAYRRTMDMLAGRGYAVTAVKALEIGKIDAGLSCMSLRWYRE